MISSNMNKNGERTKLLAVIAVFAMVACALVAFAPVADAADEPTPIQVKDDTELADALFDKAASIVLTADVKVDSVVPIGYDVKIDLGTHTITNTSETTGSVFKINGDVDVTITNGKIANSGTNTDGVSAVNIGFDSEKGGETVTLDGVTIDGKVYGVGIFGSEDLKQDSSSEPVTVVTIKNSKITAYASAVATNGSYGGESITITDSTLTSTGVSAIYAASNAVWSIEDTSIAGVSGIDMRAGSLNVSGGSITYNGPAEDKTGGDGPAAFGVGVSVLVTSGYSETGAVVNIENSVKMTAGANASTLGDVVVSPFAYDSTEGVDADSLLTTEKTVAAPVSVTYNGVEISYDVNDNATASAVEVGTNGIEVTSGNGSDIAVTPNTSVKFASVGTGATIALGTGAKADFAAEPSGVTIVAASGASVTVNGQASTVKPVDNVTVSTSEDLAKNIALGIAKITTNGDIALAETVTLGANQTLTLRGDLTISEGVTFTNNGTLVTSSRSVVLDGGVFVNNGTTTGVVKIIDSESQNGAVLENVLGTFTAENGSIVLDGDFTSDSEDADAIAKIYIRAGVLRVSGSINGNVMIAGYTETGGSPSIYDYVVIDDLSVNGKLILDVDKVYFEDVSVNNGGTLVLNKAENDTFVVGKAPETVGEVEAKFLLYGTLVPSSTPGQYGTTLYDDVTLTVNEEGEFHAYSGSILNNHITVTGEGNINLDQAQYTTVVDEDIGADRTFGQQENATIVSTLNIKAGVMVYVLGGFTVNDGVVLTIEAGATLVINSAVASMIVDGTIVVEEGATLYVNEANDVAVSGAIDSYGTLNIQSTVTVSGAIDANEDSEIVANDKLTIEVGGALNVYGVMTITDITNKGTVTLNGAILKDASTIALSSDSAVVSIVSVTGDAALTDNVTLKVTDAGLQFPDKDKTTVKDGANYVDFTIAAEKGVSGLTFTEIVTKVKGVYYNNMYIEGSVEAVDVKDYVTATPDPLSAAFTVYGSNVYVSGELVLGENVTMTIKANMTISGTITAIADGSSIVNNVDEGKNLTVTGLMQVLESKEPANTNLNAVHYETKKTTTDDAYCFYTNFAAAVASGSSQIDVYGKIVVDADITIPTGMKVQVVGNLVIGATDNRDITMTVTDGASVNGSTVDVLATLYFENKKDAKANPINSDVMIDGEKDRTYTNVYTALAGADAGETVTVTADRVVLTSNLTIPEGVILDVPNSKVLALVDGVTLTVNGTLRTAEAVEAVNEDDTAASVFATKAVKNDRTEEYASCIVVNGTFMTQESFDDFGYTYYQIPGAYYELVNDLGDYFYVTPVETADDVAAQTEESIVTVYGKVNAGDVSFVGTSADETVTIAVAAGAELTASSVSLTDAVMDVNGTFTGTVTVGDASVEAVKVQAMDVTSVEGMTIANANVEHVDATTGKTDASLTITAGTVAVGTITGYTTVDAGATLASQENADSVITGILTVDGTVTVANERTIEVERGVIVNGTVTVAAATDDKDAGSLVTPAMLVGLDDEFNTVSSTASVTGAVNVEIIYAVAGTTVDTAIVEDMNTTAYDVEGAVWINVYTTYDTMPIDSIPRDAVPVEDAYFQYWNDADGNKIVDEYIGDEATVYADVKYDVYNIIVLANQAVDDVYIDGQIMQYGMVIPSGAGQAYYAYQLTVDAGAHTISYTLANGYSGQGVLQAVSDNITVSGLTFNATGTPASASGIDMTLQLTGFEKSGYVPDSPDTGSDSGDSGMTITDYLLIVLVVLIIVMAIIVAMRLMRS